MTRIIVVEPNALLRLGILQLFQNLRSEVVCDGMDYIDLCAPPSGRGSADLMLLSAPDTYKRTAELIQAAQKSHQPARILLLAGTAHPPFPLCGLSPALVGYVSTQASTAVLTAAINLVLAGGTCFPNPDHDYGTESSTQPPQSSIQPPQPAEEPSPTHLHTSMALRVPTPTTASSITTVAITKPQALASTLVSTESQLLHLTVRQYEVLVLLARGYPIKNVSRELNISISTAKTHADTLYQRLSVHNSLAAVYEALTRGATLGLNQAPVATVPSLSQPEPYEALPPAA
ncbi:MAG TPA: response regulator transcription factor [Castellaniella sp.]|uniref:response regulator transcription factor n=1 Tax=Castellaniella sp. TaxID=1955812 RepID=UPI002F0F17B5